MRPQAHPIRSIHSQQRLRATANHLLPLAGILLNNFLSFAPFLNRLQEDDAPTLHLITTFLLFDGRANDPTFEMMKDEGAFARLVELIQTHQDEDASLHRLLLELLYEMSRIQQLRWEDLSTSCHLLKAYERTAADGISDGGRCVCSIPFSHNRRPFLRH